jgi:hypothetical protein
VITYNVYWIVVTAWFLVQIFEQKYGRLPFMKPKKESDTAPPEEEEGLNDGDSVSDQPRIAREII